MGRKSSHTGALPLDDYRRKIGKQDWKKTKKEMGEVKRQSDMKKNSHGLMVTVMEVLLMVGSFTAMLGAVYFMLYMYLHNEGTPLHVLDEQ